MSVSMNPERTEASVSSAQLPGGRSRHRQRLSLV